VFDYDTHHVTWLKLKTEKKKKDLSKIKIKNEYNFKLLYHLTIVATSGQNIVNETPSLPVDV